MGRRRRRRLPLPKIPPPKRSLLQREAGGGCECFLKVLGSVLRVGPESGGKYCRDQQESACRPEVLFAASDSIPWQTGCSLPRPLWSFGGECDVKNTLCEISPCCVIGEWCRDGRECVLLLMFGGVLDFKVEAQGGFLCSQNCVPCV